MTAIWQKELGLAVLALRPPRGRAESAAVFRPLATARLRARQFLQMLGGTQRQRPERSGDPGEPPEGNPAYNDWDEPALWIMMMH